MAGKAAQFDLVAVGGIVWEHRVQMGGFPAPGGKAAYRATELRPSGVAALCLERARQGQHVALAAVIGDDERDNRLVRQLEAAGVNTAALLRRHGAGPVERWVFEEGETGSCTTLAEEAASYPEEAISREWVASSRELWVEDGESAAAQRAIALARDAGVPVKSLAGALGVDQLHRQ
jgi:sugar/nucleoside kinase (ribokinase family)